MTEPLRATRPGGIRETKHRRPIKGTAQERRHAGEASKDFAFYAEHPDWPMDEPTPYHRRRCGT